MTDKDKKTPQNPRKKSGIFIPEDELLGPHIPVDHDVFSGVGSFYGESAAFHPPKSSFRGSTGEVEFEDYQERRMRFNPSRRDWWDLDLK